MNKKNLKYYCKACGVKIHSQTALYATGLCESCCRIGKNNGNYKHGKTNSTECLICNKIINYKSKNLLCRKCWLKSRIGCKHSIKTILKMKEYWKIHRKYIYLLCKNCHKKFKIISWKKFRIFCSKKCSTDFTMGSKRPIHSKLMSGKNNSNWQGGISCEPYSLQ